MNIPAPRAVLFDWDNTLVENWRSIQDALNVALAEYGHELFSLEQVIESARLSNREIFPRLFGADWRRAREIFLAHFKAHHLAGLRIMPGAEEALEALEAQGVALGIVSNKAGDLLRREVAHLGWSTRFLEIIGAQDAAADKPDPAPVLLWLERRNITPGADIWMVGDTDIDMRAGTAAGCSCILIGPGPTDPTLLDGVEPARVFPDCMVFAGFVRRGLSTISLES